MFNKKLFISLILVSVVKIVFATSLLCPGKYQIPSDVNHYDIVARNISQLKYKKMFRYPTRGTVENNGQTIIIKFDYKMNARPTIFEGPFENEVYRFEFIYFYWLNETQSEEYGAGSILPIELHMVFTNLRYADYETASAKNFGIAVLAFKYSVKESIRYGGIYSTLENIRHPGDKYELDASELLPLNQIFYSIDQYNAYIGKSVFPQVESEVCGADVIWLEFLSPTDMMSNQIQYFRDLLSSDDIPLMSTTGQLTVPPNTTIYQSFDHYIYEVNGWSLEPFEGLGIVFDSATRFKNSNLIVVLSLVRVIMEWASAKFPH